MIQRWRCELAELLKQALKQPLHFDSAVIFLNCPQAIVAPKCCRSMAQKRTAVKGEIGRAGFFRHAKMTMANTVFGAATASCYAPLLLGARVSTRILL